jgi:transposase
MFSDYHHLDYDKIREEEALDGYYMIITSELHESDDRIIEMYRGLWKIEESFRVIKSELEARPVYVSTQDHIEAHFLTCFIGLVIVRILETLTEHKFCVSRILDSLSKSECSLLQQNYYFFDDYDEVLVCVGEKLEIDLNRKFRTLAEIKNILGNLKK